MTPIVGRHPEHRKISTHTPAWGVTAFQRFFIVQAFNFNSHARVGRDYHFRHLGCAFRISTHTPAWGVTGCIFTAHMVLPISTHTPAWGVTFGGIYGITANPDFNSHARVGRDCIL